MFTISLNQKSRISAICNFADARINPVYEQVRIEAKDGQVTFSACNGHQYSTFTLAADVEQEESYCVSGKRLSVVTTALAGDKAKFSLISGNLLVTSGRSRLKLQTFSASQYPNMEVFTPESHIQCTIGDLTGIVNQASYCVANSDVRSYLCNMSWTVNNSSVRICATDGHRLSLVDMDFPNAHGCGSYLIPTSMFQQVLSLKLPADAICELKFSANKASVSVPQFEMMSTLGDGKYPSVDRIIPQDNSISVTFNLPELLSLSKRIHAVAALEKAPTVKFNFDTQGMCELEVNSVSCGDDFTDCIDLISHTLQENFSIGMNTKYLLDAITKQGGDTVTFVLNPQGAIKIQSNNPNLITLVMPVRC